MVRQVGLKQTFLGLHPLLYNVKHTIGVRVLPIPNCFHNYFFLKFKNSYEYPIHCQSEDSYVH